MFVQRRTAIGVVLIVAFGALVLTTTSSPTAAHDTDSAARTANGSGAGADVYVTGPTAAVNAEGCEPKSTPAPSSSSFPRLIGDSGYATASAVAADRVLLRIHNHQQPEASVEVTIGAGWLSKDGQRLVLIGFVRDGGLGQTYAVVRREVDSAIVRQWIAPNDPLVYSIPWPEVNSTYTFPTGVIVSIPLDDLYPQANQLVRRFDGADNRIFAYDAGLRQWRHIPDLGTFQARGFFWCDVTSADAVYFERITIGPPYPSAGVPARADYPVCSTQV